MKTKHLLTFPLSLTYKGTTIETKAMKCAYPGYETLYKVALPSVLSTVPVCWIIRDGKTWKFGLETKMDAALKARLIDAIVSHDKTKSIYPAYSESSLKSA